jgi:hypothetical protein
VLEERSEIYTGSSGEGNRAPAKEANVAIDIPVLLTSLVRMVCVFSDVFRLRNTEIVGSHSFDL